jgi:hypothetical protein
MQNTDKEFFERLLRELPSSYAKILFAQYKKKNMPYGKSIIYKVAYGERENTIILNDLIQL